MTPKEFIDKVKNIDFRAIAYMVLERHNEDLVWVQKSQLWAGRNLDGTLLTPSILNDPYFKTPKQAQAWSNYKDKQTQWRDDPDFGARPKGTPNLIFTTGEVVWEPLTTRFTGSGVFLGTEFSIENELEDKYGEIFGLNPQGVKYVLENWFYDEFSIEVYKQLLN